MSDTSKQVEAAIRQAASKRGLDLMVDRNRFAVAHEAAHNANGLGSIEDWYVRCYPDLQTALQMAHILAIEAIKWIHHEVYVLDCVAGTCCELRIL